MPRDTFKIRPVGIIDRRGIVTTIQDINVLSRENLMVIGQSEKERYVKKVSGTRRYNATSVGSYPVVSMARYLSKTITKSFFFSGGSVYYIDPNGNTTQLSPVGGLGVFDQNAIPVFIGMRVSGSDILYFIEGINTGMYSYDGNIGNAFTKEIAVTLNFVDAVEYLDRMFAFEEDSEDLYFSKNLDPTNFTDSSDAGVITIGARRGSKNQKLAVLNETLYIFKNDQVYVLEGRTPSEFQVRLVIPDKGLGARYSLAKVEGVLVGLMSDFEVWSFSGDNSSMECLSYNIALGGDYTKEVLSLIDKNRMTQARAIYHNFLYRLSFTGTGETQNNWEWCYNTVNKTDFLTHGNRVASYLPYGGPPDKNELLTGRSDAGIIMYQYDKNLDYDNDASGATMSIKTKTKFVGLDSARNFRVRRMWLNSGVLGGGQIGIKTYIDARNAPSDSTSEQMDIFGESKSPITLMKIASQDAITSRQIPRHNNAKCQSISLEISEDISNRDFQFSSFEIEIIQKGLKRSRHVGV